MGEERLGSGAANADFAGLDYSFSYTPQNLFWSMTCDYIEYAPLENEDGPILDEQGKPKLRVTVHLPERPIGLGLEMREGAWVMQPDGTLYFFGGTWLYGGMFDTHMNKVKRIVIDDFNYIIGPQFEGFPQLEEVVFSNPAVHVDHRAFAGCHKLRTVRFRDEPPYSADWTEDDAFADTPYAAHLNGEDFVSEPEGSAVLAKSEWGRAFLEALHQAIEHMEFDPDNGYGYDVEHECDMPLVPCKQALCQGYLAGDADMMYLAAECDNWGPRFINTFDGGLMDFGQEETPVGQMYLAAADAGSVRAMLFVAWLMDPDVYGTTNRPTICEDMLECDAQKSAYYLTRARAASEPLQTLEITDLAFLKNEVERLREAAYDADRLEDEMLYGVHPDPDRVPNPSWRTLHERCDDLANLTCNLGSTCCGRGVSYYNESTYDDGYALVSGEKASWAAWCREKGMLV